MAPLDYNPLPSERDTTPNAPRPDFGIDEAEHDLLRYVRGLPLECSQSGQQVVGWLRGEGHSEDAAHWALHTLLARGVLTLEPAIPDDRAGGGGGHAMYPGGWDNYRNIAVRPADRLPAAGPLGHPSNQGAGADSSAGGRLAATRPLRPQEQAIGRGDGECYLNQHPDWTNAQIAAQVPCHPKSMYRFKRNSWRPESYLKRPDTSRQSADRKVGMGQSRRGKSSPDPCQVTLTLARLLFALLSALILSRKTRGFVDSVQLFSYPRPFSRQHAKPESGAWRPGRKVGNPARGRRTARLRGLSSWKRPAPKRPARRRPRHPRVEAAGGGCRL